MTTPQRTLDAPGMACIDLTPLIAKTMRDLQPGEVLAVNTDDPAARVGVPAWCRLTGNRLVQTSPDHTPTDQPTTTLPFIVGNVSATADQDTVVFLTSDAVWLATPGYADDISYADHPPVGKILADFVANGGRVWACGACTGPRGITADDLVDGAAIVTAANLVEALAAGAATVAF